MNENDYIEYKLKKLTSGLISNVYYNFRKLSIKDIDYLVKKLNNLSKGFIVIGIKTVGWEIVKLLFQKKRLFSFNPKNCIFQNYWSETIMFPSFKNYIIFDDVITTFGTIRKCILVIRNFLEKVICIKNRLNIIELINIGI